MKRRAAWMRLATLGLGMALASGALAPAAPPARAPRPQVVDHNRRAFRIPLNIPKEDVPRYKQFQLWSSADGGGRWEKGDTTTLDRPFFSFSAQRDGEYWFAVRTVDTKGRLFPADDADIEPIMKVIVDTRRPTMLLEARKRRGNFASVHWEVTDEHLDLGSLVIEYQAEGARDWARAPIARPARIGIASWDAGTAEAIKVRGTISDRAGNTESVAINLPDGTATASSGPGTGESADPDAPPPVGTFASGGAERSPPQPLSGPPPMPSMDGGPVAGAGTAPSGDFNPFASNAPAASTPPSGASTAQDSAAPPILVSNPKFGLQYAVDDAGPLGPAAVELWVTTDGGRTWFSRGEDPDRASPFPVDLGGEGSFGLKLVAKSAANQGDRPPTSGEPPVTIVEVDSSGPAVKLDPPRMAGARLVINWHASDPHPAPRPVMISIKADSPEGKWQFITPTPIENSGQFTWTVPQGCPPKIHVRVDVRDSLGNMSFAETAETAPVLVDRSKPKGRIIGLDPAARETAGPSARPLR